MHLQRVQVPDFRALKNVDITFEQERIPRIFPLASQNGGGKSTLLQLIFVLLTCPFDESKHQFLKNILKDFAGSCEVDSPRILAVIDLIDEDKKISLEFTCLETSKLINNYYESKPGVGSKLLETSGFLKCSKEFDEVEKIVVFLDRKIASLQRENLEHIAELIERDPDFPAEPYMTQELRDLVKDFIASKKLSGSFDRYQDPRFFANKELLPILNGLQNELRSCRKRREEIFDQHEYLREACFISRQAINLIQTEENQYICSYYAEEQIEHNLFCQITGDIEDMNSLTKVSRNVFFASSGNQVFILLERSDINALFSERHPEERWYGKRGYEDKIREIQNNLPGFFLYDFSMIKILTEVFKSAMERDGRKAIQSRGQYGSEFAKLLDNLTGIFSGKMIEPLEDLSGIRVRTADGDVLYLGDLSHGELRRLTFYAWLKTKEIQDAIVLVDEIEIGLHPDWQYQIVKDLEDWAPSNQYILATHSYDVCSALTPAHVKEIEPKLTQKSTPAVN